MADLFQLTELASLLQQDLDTSTATLARAMATAVVEDAAGTMGSTTATIEVPIGAGGRVDLPVTAPVTDVTAVVVAGAAATFEWQKPFKRLRLLSWTATPGIDSSTWRTAVVTLEHGWPVVPPIAKAVALSLAKRLYSNPEALESYSIDDHSARRSVAEAFLSPLERAALDRLMTSTYSTAG